MAASTGGCNWKEAKKRLEAERAKYGGKTRGEILEEMLSTGAPYKKAVAAAWAKLELYENTSGGKYNGNT